MKNNLILLLTLFMALCVSCEGTGPERKYVYRIDNLSDFDVKIVSFLAETKQETQVIEINNNTRFQVDSLMIDVSDTWSLRSFLAGDSVKITFSDGKNLMYKCFKDGEGCRVERSVFNAFTRSVEDEKRLKTITHSYEITNQDYELAE